jgi:inner membrane protein involved in colicin E2 resistance
VLLQRYDMGSFAGLRRATEDMILSNLLLVVAAGAAILITRRIDRFQRIAMARCPEAARPPEAGASETA